MVHNLKEQEKNEENSTLSESFLSLSNSSLKLLKAVYRYEKRFWFSLVYATCARPQLPESTGETDFKFGRVTRTGKAIFQASHAGKFWRLETR